MPTDTSVKFLHSGMTGHPDLAGQAGSMIALLDACLVNGFNLVTVDSVVISGGVGTITRGAGLAFEPHSVALLAGATVTGGSINGERKIVATTATTATFDATGISNQTATGTITAKMAPLGWAKTYAGTNLAAYKPTDVSATGCLLRIDDTGTTLARARGYETMSDINTGTGLFPTDALLSGGVYWPKSGAGDSSARNWILVGDGRIFYLMVSYTTAGATSFGFNHLFGDVQSVKSPDAYSCMLHGLPSSSLGTAGNNGASDFDECNGVAVSNGTYMARSYTALGVCVTMRKAFPFVTGGVPFKSGTASLPYPNYADGGLYLSQFNVMENSSNVYRGAVPGLYGIPHSVGGSVFASRELLTGVTGFVGKAFRVVNSVPGCFAFDATGPWR